MPPIVYITPQLAVAGELAPEDFAAVARRGFRAIISNRPDGEDPGQLLASEKAVLSWRNGLAFRHIPAFNHDLFDPTLVEAMADALQGLDGPVLAVCRSGRRSAILLAAVSARTEPIDCVVATLAAAGFDVAELREELAAQAGRKRSLGRAAPVDCGEVAGGSRAAA